MAPELPGDPGEDDLPTPQILVAPMGSDDSDNEDDAYAGYQPLSIMDDMELPGGGGGTVGGGGGGTYEQMDDAEQPHMGNNIEEMDEDNGAALENGERVEPAGEEEVEVTHGDPNLPHVESADAEIERQVWREPRPQELQIELDNTKTEQILSAMASFTLPNMAVPEWAAGVPEERWKEELLQRIRQRSGAATAMSENEKK